MRDKDQRIVELSSELSELWPQIENKIDELKVLGPHSFEGFNALNNAGDWLQQLAVRAKN